MVSSSRVVVAWILGGLGNQMFQYAAGAALAHRTGAQLLLDRSDFDGYPLRHFALGAFGIDVPTWSGVCPLHGVLGQVRRVRQRLANTGYLFQPRMQLLIEQGFAWGPVPEFGWSTAYMHGFWQSPRYFSPIEADLRRQFDPLRFMTPALQEVHRRVSEPNCVAVHVRRGDYATNPAALAVHGLLDDAWYHRALNLMRRLVPGCRFEVFSDDPAAAQLLFNGCHDVVFQPLRTQEEDLLLMSSCRHKIIANSTFSWWAAWLGQERSGLVVAPQRWFSRERLLTTTTVDLFPEGWILV